MNVIRKIILFIFGALLPVFLLSFGLLFGLFQVLGSPQRIESALSSSGAYDDTISSLIKENATNNGADSLQSPEAQEAVQKAVDESVTDEYLKQQTTGVLKNISAWLNGDTQNLDFSINLNTAKTQLVENITKQAEQRAMSLPTCSQLDSFATTLSGAGDAFSLSCIPAGVTAADVAAQTRQELENSAAFQDANVTPDTLLGNRGTSIEEQLEPIRGAYQTAKKVMYASGIAALIAIAMIIWLSRPHHVGVKRAAYALMSMGITGVLSALITKYGLSSILRNVLQNQGRLTGGNVSDAIYALIADVCNWWLWMSIVSIVIAIASLIGIKIWNKRQRPSDEVGDSNTKIDRPIPQMNNSTRKLVQ